MDSFEEIAKIKDNRIKTIALNCQADPEFVKGLTIDDFNEKYGDYEIYTREAVQKYSDDVMKSVSDAKLEDTAVALLEKAKKNISELTPKVITDKNGRRRTVYVKIGSESKEKKQKKVEESSKIKEATDHIIEEEDGKFAIDTLDPDTEEVKFKEGDKITFKTDKGEKKTGTVGKEIEDGIHSVQTVGKKEKDQKVKKNISELSITGKENWLEDLPEGWSKGNIQAFQSKGDEKSFSEWNSKNPIKNTLDLAQSKGLIKKSPVEFGDPVIMNNGEEFDYDELNDIQDEFGDGEHGFVLTTDFKGNSILVLKKKNSETKEGSKEKPHTSAKKGDVKVGDYVMYGGKAREVTEVNNNFSQYRSMLIVDMGKTLRQITSDEVGSTKDKRSW